MKQLTAPLHIKNLAYTTLGALSLLCFAFFNGYPIVYSDTSTYIESGFVLQPPFDRPLTYGVFIRLFSFNGASLWSVIFMQSLFLSSLLLMTIKEFCSTHRPYVYFLFVIAFLSAFTVLPFVCGQLITDVFPSIGILCLLQLLLKKNISKPQQIALFVLFFITNAMHMSHLLLNVSFLLMILLVQKFLLKEIKLNKSNLVITLILSLLGITIMGSSVSKSKHVFFVSRMAENGILQKYLAENCQNQSYKLCSSLETIPDNTTDFLWHKDSPLNTQYDSWSSTKTDFNHIISSTLLSPSYLVLHIKGAISNSLKQLITFKAGDGTGIFLGETTLYQRVKKYFPSESSAYSESRQSKGKLNVPFFSSINRLYHLIIGISIAVIIFLFSYKLTRVKFSPKVKFLTFAIVIAIFLNATINASLVIIADRFGAKLIWLLPLTCLIMIEEVIKLSKLKQKKLNP